jgi:hypothetical protein
MVERCLIIVEHQHILTCIHKLKIKLIITVAVLLNQQISENNQGSGYGNDKVLYEVSGFQSGDS